MCPKWIESESTEAPFVEQKISTILFVTSKILLYFELNSYWKPLKLLNIFTASL